MKEGIRTGGDRGDKEDRNKEVYAVVVKEGIRGGRGGEKRERRQGGLWRRRRLCGCGEGRG